MKTLAIAVMLGAAASSGAAAQPMEILGYAGVLGEWELAGTVAPIGSASREFSGPLKMTHVGVCTQDGPEVKKAEMRLQISGAASAARMKATLLIDGVPCTYAARLSDSYSGMMNCPGQRPTPLKIWVK
jgi:hypothetical protein